MSASQLAERPLIAGDSSSLRTSRAELRKARSRSARKNALLARYIGYVGYFVGAGLISGAVVHHPLDPARYTRIAGYGVLVFLAATVLNEYLLAEKKPALPRMLQVMGASLLLSFGIGMLSGGLQHFEDFPARAAMLVPLGIAVSFVAFVIKDADTSWRRIFGLPELAVLMVVLAAGLGLQQVAASMSEPADGGGHSHGAAEEGKDGEPSEGKPQEGAPAGIPKSTAPSPNATPKKEAAHADDGHGH
ncbi:hypothetical protein OG304_04680 [Streptomyces sp. NBC_00160]|uniref:hypothetical protein n=1 Tax=Streptomyces sp. NBC_00160 TaxID=2903628 RepID=UPI00225A0AF4|nr:hypothetical protein [Streptomyces sp. NBC_00160]MCX5302748.1 hypothetical protein [Streptomyces sp. NBC_00160]